MHITMLKCKLHKACVTHAELNYEGSCAIDGKLLDMAGIREYEKIHIYNIANGQRFSTYAIRGEDNSGMISLNGAAARMAAVGDRIIICAYANYDEAEANRHQPTMIYLDEANDITGTRNVIPVQAA